MLPDSLASPMPCRLTTITRPHSPIEKGIVRLVCRPYSFFGKISTVLPLSHPSNPTFKPGQVLRTEDLRQWSANPSRLGKRLVLEGKLEFLKQGLYLAPRSSKFGKVPPDNQALLQSFLKNTPYIETGPAAWNALGLGSTSLFAGALVYNTKRSGRFTLAGKTFDLRRVRFPVTPTPEWFVVDLLEHHDEAGVSLDTLESRLAAAMRTRRFDREKLLSMAEEFGTHRTLRVIIKALREAGLGLSSSKSPNSPSRA